QNIDDAAGLGARPRVLVTAARPMMGGGGRRGAHPSILARGHARAAGSLPGRCSGVVLLARATPATQLPDLGDRPCGLFPPDPLAGAALPIPTSRPYHLAAPAASGERC